MSIDNITPREWNKARKDVSYDPVLKPEHYNKGDVESWDIIKQQVDDWPSYLEANVLKYILRYKWKDSNLQDLRKCKVYLERLIEHYEEL